MLPISQPSLTAVTIKVANIDSILNILPDETKLSSWIKNGEGIVGWGEAYKCDIDNFYRMTQVEKIWKALCDKAEISDAVKLPGSGLVAFGALTFSQNSETPSSIIIPNIVVGKRNGQSWITIIQDSSTTDIGFSIPKLIKQNMSTEISNNYIYSEGISLHNWEKKLNFALKQISDKKIDKIVLARKLVIRSKTQLSTRKILNSLNKNYPTCWIYAVDGLLGATPEMLLEIRDNKMTARILAGTATRAQVTTIAQNDYENTTEDTLNSIAKENLFSSSKERNEHQYALESAIKNLSKYCKNIVSPPEPFLLTLPNLWHLASDISGELKPNITLFKALEELHPTAAVCGTPRSSANKLLSELEDFDRGRYAGPVGWVDYANNSDWGIALRGGQIVSNNEINIFAGCGIVKGSIPQQEYQETQSKFAPMLQALDISQKF